MSDNKKEVRSFIYVKTQFEHIHHWPDAPEKGQLSGKQIGFLKHPHRHTFRAVVSCEVGELNRQVEFFDLKQLLDDTIRDNKHKWYTYSCEMMAKDILDALDQHYLRIRSVEVNEDDENGAFLVVYRE